MQSAGNIQIKSMSKLNKIKQNKNPTKYKQLNYADIVVLLK